MWRKEGGRTDLPTSPASAHDFDSDFVHFEEVIVGVGFCLFNEG